MTPASFPPLMPTAASVLRNLEQEMLGLLELSDPEQPVLKIPRRFVHHWLAQVDRVRRLLPDSEE